VFLAEQLAREFQTFFGDLDRILGIVKPRGWAGSTLNDEAEAICAGELNQETVQPLQPRAVPVRVGAALERQHQHMLRRGRSIRLIVARGGAARSALLRHERSVWRLSVPRACGGRGR